MNGAREVTVLIVAGGTGGHVFPGLAVAEELRRRGARVLWLGTPRGIERELVGRAGIEFHAVAVEALRGKGFARVPLAAVRSARAAIEVLRLLRSRRPHVMLGMGGYVSGPAGIAAWIARVPLVVHEQNAVPGLTNRLLSRFARRVLEAFPRSFPPALGALHTGNPVRAEIAALPPPQQRVRGDDGVLRIFVLGGSQGALVLNQVIPAALAALARHQRVDVCHQAGARHADATRQAYRVARLDVEPLAFIDDMASRYAWADVVVCRAGAMTVCELAAAGVASILVPFPHAVDDHQSANARFLSDAGAAVLLPQSKLTAQRLSTLLADLASHRERLLEMARAARALAVADAGARVAVHCMEVARA